LKEKDSGTKIVLFESKLEEEAAKVAGALIGRTAGGVMDTVSDVFGGLVGDAVREWRTRNLISRLARTAEILKAMGVSLDRAKALPMGEAYAMFEEASKQDDETVAEMWSALLANAMHPDLDVKIEPAFVATLKIMGPLEAKVFRLIKALKVYRRLLVAELHHHGSERNMTLGVRREISERLSAQIDVLREKHIPGIHDSTMNIALSNLVKERCLCVPAPAYRSWRLVSRGRSEFGELELVDPARVEDALNDVAWSINEHAGHSDAQPGLLREDYIPNELSFDLTDYGVRLLAACEPTDTSAPA
jgi:hypothetical protein